MGTPAPGMDQLDLRKSLMTKGVSYLLHFGPALLQKMHKLRPGWVARWETDNEMVLNEYEQASYFRLYGGFEEG